MPCREEHHGASRSQHADQEERALRACAPQGRAHLHVRAHGLRADAHRPRAHVLLLGHVPPLPRVPRLSRGQRDQLHGHRRSHHPARRRARGRQSTWPSATSRASARDCRALHIKDYAVYTRATDFIDEQVADGQGPGRQAATPTPSTARCSTRCESYAPYGQLSGNKLEDQEVGASGRVERGRLAQEAPRGLHARGSPPTRASRAGAPASATGPRVARAGTSSARP